MSARQVPVVGPPYLDEARRSELAGDVEEHLVGVSTGSRHIGVPPNGGLYTNISDSEKFGKKFMIDRKQEKDVSSGGNTCIG
jgi:hypothetical protein